MSILDDATIEMIKVLNIAKSDEIEKDYDKIKESIKKFAVMIKQIT